MNRPNEFLFELPPSDLTRLTRRFRQLPHPIWTENKAKLIERYLYYFVQITRHGTYMDAFAGPQDQEKHEMWAAKLVLESRPRWLRHFFLFELNPTSLEMLNALKDNQPPRTKKEPKRTVRIYPGDFNQNIKTVLSENPIREKEATFCLLDQRTFECDWASVETLARHKQKGNKIELFYFLPNGWLDRGVAGLKNDKEARLKKWWGNSNWDDLLKRRGAERAKYASERFRTELGYACAQPFPIFEKKAGGKTMYFMIHASDHPDATALMYRAYNKALGVAETAEQLEFLRGREDALKGSPGGAVR